MGLTINRLNVYIGAVVYIYVVRVQEMQDKHNVIHSDRLSYESKSNNYGYLKWEFLTKQSFCIHSFFLCHL